MDRRALLAAAAAGLAGAALAQPIDPAATPASPTSTTAPLRPSDRLGASGEPFFIDWLNGFYARASAAGMPQALLDESLRGLAEDPRVVALDARQPEFARPVGAYIQSTVSAERIETGRRKCVEIPQLETIEQVWGVPREILVAIWAMETRFGAQTGDMDIIRCLATLAALGRRRAWAENELMAALKIVADGDAPRERLRGSWAGAMGQTQFLPSTYLSAAADGDGDGRRDIWNSPPDALASTANLLRRDGWRRDEGWAREVLLTADFDVGLSEGPREAPSWWAAKGAAPADGRPWSEPDRLAPCLLLLPAGSAGPAFLALPNHFVIRKYNNALAYALAVGLLADGFDGGHALARPWPAETPLSLDDRLAAQAALTTLGYNVGVTDGVIGLGSRQALRAWQKSQRLPADGYLSGEMVARLKAAAAVAGEKM